MGLHGENYADFGPLSATLGLFLEHIAELEAITVTGGGRLQPVLMRHTPQLSVKTQGGGGRGGQLGGDVQPGVGGGGVWPRVRGGRPARGEGGGG